MPVLTTGEGTEDQVAPTKSKHKRKKRGKKSLTSSNPLITVRDEADTDVHNSGAVDPLIIYLSDDDDNEEDNRIIMKRSISDLGFACTDDDRLANPEDDTPRWSATTVSTFTAQCNSCGKWRLVPSMEQYYAISDRLHERPFVCEEAQAWRENPSCQDPTDISENEPSLLWAVDETIIPKPPSGYNRGVVVRGERSSTFADVSYRAPCGRKLRSMKHVQRFLDNTERYKSSGINISQFSIVTPKPGANLHKRAFKKDGKVWKRVTNADESRYSQPAITAGLLPRDFSITVVHGSNVNLLLGLDCNILRQLYVSAVYFNESLMSGTLLKSEGSYEFTFSHPVLEMLSCPSIVRWLHVGTWNSGDGVLPSLPSHCCTGRSARCILCLLGNNVIMAVIQGFLRLSSCGRNVRDFHWLKWLCRSLSASITSPGLRPRVKLKHFWWEDMIDHEMESDRSVLMWIWRKKYRLPKIRLFLGRKAYWRKIELSTCLILVKEMNKQTKDLLLGEKEKDLKAQHWQEQANNHS